MAVSKYIDFKAEEPGGKVFLILVVSSTKA